MSKISFVLPTHNREKLIGDTIDSVLKQTISDWELVVVDDHSDPGDKTEEVIKSFSDNRIRYIKLPDLKGRGVSCGRNFGNAQARGEIIAVCDSDDIYMPKRAELILDSYQNKKWDVFYGKYLAFSEGIDPYIVKENKQIAFDINELKKRNYIPNASVAYPRKIALHYPYNSYLNTGEDYDFFTRLAVDGKKFYFCDEIIFHYRIHKENLLGENRASKQEEFIKINRGWK